MAISYPVTTVDKTNVRSFNQIEGAALASGAAISTTAAGLHKLLYGTAYVNDGTVNAGTMDFGIGANTGPANQAVAEFSVGGLATTTSCQMPFFALIAPEGTWSMYCKSDGPTGGKQGFTVSWWAGVG